MYILFNMFNPTLSENVQEKHGIIHCQILKKNLISWLIIYLNFLNQTGLVAL